MQWMMMIRDENALLSMTTKKCKSYCSYTKQNNTKAFLMICLHFIYDHFNLNYLKILCSVCALCNSCSSILSLDITFVWHWSTVKTI